MKKQGQTDRPKFLQPSQNAHKFRVGTIKEKLATVRLKTFCLSVCPLSQYLNITAHSYSLTVCIVQL